MQGSNPVSGISPNGPNGRSNITWKMLAWNFRLFTYVPVKHRLSAMVLISLFVALEFARGVLFFDCFVDSQRFRPLTNQLRNQQSSQVISGPQLS
jgi:hypothetical protein